MGQKDQARGYQVESDVSRRVLCFLLRWATWRNVLILWGLLAAFLVVVVGPAYRRIETLSGGTGALDLLIVYPPEKAYERMTVYGDQGRRYYASIALTVDTVFPLLSGLTFTLTIVCVFRRAFSTEGVLHRALFVPLAAMAADLLENAGIATLLLSYPRGLPVIALLTSSFSTVKWTAVVAQSLLVVIGLIAWLLREM